MDIQDLQLLLCLYIIIFCLLKFGKKLKSRIVEIIFPLLFYYVVFIYLQTIEPGISSAILIIFSGLGVLSLFNNMLMTLAGCVMGILTLGVGYQLYKDAIFLDYSVKNVFIRGFNYFLTGVLLIIANRLSARDQDTLRKNSHEIGIKNEKLSNFISQVTENIKQLNRINDHVNHNIEGVNEATMQIGDSLNVFAASMEEQNAQIEEIDSNMIQVHEIVGSVGDVSKGLEIEAVGTKGILKETQKLTSHISSIINELCEQIGKISTNIECVEGHVSTSENIREQFESSLGRFNKNVEHTLITTATVNQDISGLKNISDNVMRNMDEFIKIIQNNTEVLTEIQTSLAEHQDNVSKLKEETLDLNQASKQLEILVTE